MKKKSIKLNAVLSSVKQVLSIIFPLVTVPYVSRVLMAENYGKLNFARSIVNYFALAAALGINSYAVREGAMIREDKRKFQNFSNQMFTINMISTFISLGGMALLVFLSADSRLTNEIPLYLIYGTAILLTSIGADWVNVIFEDYTYITVRYCVCHLVSLLLMFVVIKKPDDYVVYALISTFASSGGYIFNVAYIRKYTHLKLQKGLDLRRHLKPILYLFASSLAVTIYVNSDITLLGFIKGEYDVGVYSVSSKIYFIVKQVLNAAITVSIPRLSSYYASNDCENYHALLDKIFNCILTVAIPAGLGLFVLRKEIINIIGGESYLSGDLSLGILSIALVFAVISCYFTKCLLTVNRMDFQFMTASLVSAIANIALNFLLIPSLTYNGAAITTVIAEIIVMLMTMYMLKGKYLGTIWSSTTKSIIFSIVCIIAIAALSGHFLTGVKHLITTIVVCGLSCVLIWKITGNIIYSIIENLMRRFKEKSH